MTPREQSRLQVLSSLLAEHMTLDQAAALMGVSPRHARPILEAYRGNGASPLAHGLRGRKPPNAIPEPVRSRVVHLAATICQGANHSHLSELPGEREGIDIGRTTLRRILADAGLNSPRRRRPPKHRVRRQRMPGRECCYGWTAVITAGWARPGRSSRCSSPWRALPSAIRRTAAATSGCCRA